MKKLALILTLSLLLTGCDSTRGTVFGNYRSLRQLLIIETIGVDRPGCTVSVSSGGDSNESPPVVISQESDTIPRALNKIQDYASKEHLFYAHTNDIIIGELAAESGIYEVLEFIQRSKQLRLDINLLVVKGGTAQSLISGTAGDGTSVTEIIAALERDVELRSEGRIFTCAQVSQMLAKTGSALIYAVEPSQTEGTVYSESPEVTALPAGFCVIKDGRLAGYISASDARGVSVLQNRVSGGTAVLETERGVLTTVEYISSQSEMKPEWDQDGRLRSIRIDASVEAGISAATAPVNVESTEYISKLEESLAEKTAREITAVVGKLRDTGADFLDIAGVVERTNPQRYSEIADDWDEALRELTFEISTNARITRSYNMEGSVDYVGGAV